ncbi:GAF domain-containing protein [Chloroflexia bacterium SDU3-3]|nr:GAF domain-containing protein [Chloroflexia bacterium SDU3-3]
MPMIAQWLAQHRTTLLPRWIARLEAVTTPQLVGVSASEADPASGVVSHPNERDVLVASIYDGLVEAAGGNYELLDECLKLLRALRTSEGEDELCDRLELTFHLRRVIWDQIFEDPLPEGDRRILLDDAERLIEYTTLSLAEHWTTAAAAIRQQLQHSELFAQSLAESAEQADQIALQLHNLNTLASELAASLDPDALVNTAGSKLVEVLGAAHVSVWLAKGEHGLSVAQQWGESIEGSFTVDPAKEHDIILQSYRTHQIVFASAPEAQAQGAWYQPSCGVLAVPLITQDVVTGIIVVQDPEPDEKLTRTQQDFVVSVANQSAIALQNAGLYAEVREFNSVLEQRIADRTKELQIERDMLSTLNQISLEISSTLDLDMLLESSLHALADLIGADHGSIMLIENDTEHLVDRAVLGRSRETVGFTRFPVGQGIAGWVAQSRQPALVPDVNSDERWVSLPKSDLGRKQTGSMALVPLIVQGELTGVMSLSHDDVGYFNDDHMRLLGASAGAIALGINNARLYDEILRESMRKGEMLQNERRATTQSNAILQSLSDGVVVCDVDGLVLTANPAAGRVLNMPLEDLLIMPLPDLLGKMLAQRAKEVPVESVLRGKSDMQSYATDFQRGRRMIRVTLDPVATDKDEVIGAVAVFRDITREVESDRLKDEFIGTVSHELRTPMTSIKGFTQLLAMGSLGPVNEQQKEFLSTIHTNAERMISIINDLLDLTKIEAGSVDLDLRPLHVAEALGTVIADVQSSIQLRQHELQIQIPPGLPLVRADARRFDQILTHLITNAVKYTPVGGKLKVAAHEVDSTALPEEIAEKLTRGRYVQVDITDTGVGILPEEQDLIFNRFYRTENRLKVEAGGTGLGLSLVRPLMKLFGGNIWLQSVPDEGSTFSIVLPAV